MRNFSPTQFLAGAISLAILCPPLQALSQPAPAPVRPAPARPAVASKPKPVVAPGQQPAARPVAAAPRGGAACHTGMSFDTFLAVLNNQTVANRASNSAQARSGHIHR